MKVVIIDYGAGNIFSVEQAFRRLGIDAVLSNDEQVIRSATHVVFPGVGHARTAMEELKKTGLDRVIPTLKQPVLGICLGMQLMCGWNEEGNLNGLEIFDARIFELKTQFSKYQNSKILELENSKLLNPDSYRDYKIRRTPENTAIQNGFSNCQFPHMGWNDVISDGKSEAFYFVHSYAAEICESTWGIAEYPKPFSASLRKDNFWGVQFHPEKSGEAGERLIWQFLKSNN